MKVVYLNESSTVYPIEAGVVLALGFFDGLHLAHQRLIEEAIITAKHKNVKSGVLTFNPSPKQFLGKVSDEALLTPHNKKIELLSNFDLDYLFIVQFNEHIAKLSPKQFINRFLTSLNVVHVVTGFDFHYGYKGKGNVHTLQADGDQRFGLSIIEEVQINHEKISSTRIRELITTGRVEEVKTFLGREYTTDGIVIHGFKRGRELGFPTANIALLDQYVVPQNGVYAVKVDLFQKTYLGMCNVGYNPTFNVNNNRSIEVHILDFNKDIYNEKLTITWYKKIRDEQKFASVDLLIEQLSKDQETVKAYFSRKSHDL